MSDPSHPGLFVAVEGPDGVGKSTACRALAQWICERGSACTHVHEPGGTGLGERIREILLTPSHPPGADPSPVPMAELLLFMAARAQLLETVIRPALARGEVVIADRFVDSTRIYQGIGRGLGIRLVDDLHALALPDHPDLTLVLRISPAEAARRRHRRQGATDRIEQDGALQELISGAYDEISLFDDVALIDASGPEGEVLANCQAAVVSRLPRLAA